MREKPSPPARRRRMFIRACRMVLRPSIPTLRTGSSQQSVPLARGFLSG